MALVAGEDERAALRDLPEPLHADAKRRAVAIVEAKERRRPRKALTRSTADGSVPLTHDL